MIRGLVQVGLAATLAVAMVPNTIAQQFPSKPVRAIIPFPPGSGPDTVMRLVGDKISREWGQPFVVENRPGGNAWIALDAAKKSPADGYTLVQITNEQMSIQPHIYKQMPFDFDKDFEPIAPLYSTHFFVVLPANSPWNSVSDLIAAAKAKPGSLSYGSWGIGSVAHVSGAMFEQAAGATMTHVPFTIVTQLYGAVANGDVSWAMGSAATAGPLQRAGKVKYIALAAPKRLNNFPDIPTVAEAGGPADFEARAFVGLFAPRGVPRAIAERIERDVARALNEPDVRGKLIAVGFEPSASDAKGLAQAMAADSRRFSAVAKRANISID